MTSRLIGGHRFESLSSSPLHKKGEILMFECLLVTNPFRKFQIIQGLLSTPTNAQHGNLKAPIKGSKFQNKTLNNDLDDELTVTSTNKKK